MNGPHDEASRRRVLAAVLAGGGALAPGCVGPLGEGAATPVADATAAVEVPRVRAFSAGLPVEATVEADRPWATDDHPPAVTVTLANHTARTVEFVAGEGEWAVISDRTSETVGPGVALLGADVPDGRSPAPEDPGGCWKLADDTGNPLRVRTLTRLDPGATLTRQFEVWGHHGNRVDVCLPAGEFAFADAYTVESDPAGREFEWGFSLRIEAA